MKHSVGISDDQIRVGRAVLIKPGRDITIVAAGPQLKTVMESLDMLDEAGIDAEVIYPHTIKPFDYELVAKSVQKTRKYLVIEEHAQFGGVGDEVMRATLDIENTKAAYINIPDRFLHWYGHYHEFCEALGMTAKNVVSEVKRLCR
jgi:transketolase